MPDSWRGQGSCIEIDPEFFFPEGTLPAAVAQAEEAKAVCWACPVLGQCREFELALVDGRLRNEHGVAAAMTADERRAELVRRRRRAQRAAAARQGVAA
jgi:WhiB family redox-sensing transcriptional regulator